MSAHDLLYEAEGSAESTLGAALKNLEELARYDSRFAEPAQQLAAAKATVEDVDAEVREFAEGINAAPGRLEEIEDRLARTRPSQAQIWPDAGRRDGVRSRGRATAGRGGEPRCSAGGAEGSPVTGGCSLPDCGGGPLRQPERGRPVGLEPLAEAQINDLAMHVRFKVQVTPDRSEASWSPHGWDQVECLIATNAGEPLKPLHEIASGGEMSRVMLALKVTVEETAGSRAGRRKKTALPRTLVFDEIDIGIGGRAAEAVGRKLKMLSTGQQVLCITHLPQIAAFADQHFLIEKTEKRGRTQTDVRRMDDVERVQEIARMLSGAKLTETSLKHAEHLLQTSR